MRFIILLIFFLSFVSNIQAALSPINTKKMQEGTFRKSITGKIIQYDKHGKKIGTYKLKNGRYYKIK